MRFMRIHHTGLLKRARIPYVSELPVGVSPGTLGGTPNRDPSSHYHI